MQSSTSSVITGPEFLPQKAAHAQLLQARTTSCIENMKCLSYFAAVGEDLTYVFLCVSRPTEQCHEVGDNCITLQTSEKIRES